jgi:hypothetical protein
MRINLSVTTDDQEVVARATEHFARAASGLAMDGVEGILMFGPDDDESPAE